MERKPIILILTSKDELGDVSKNLAEAIRKTGTHNAVVISDDKYGSAKKLSALDRLMDKGMEYQYLLESKDKSVLKDRFKVKSLSKRVNRINNLIRRFHPEYILCVTPYAHHCAVEAKRKARFTTRIMYMVQSFTANRRGLDDTTSVFIVENADIKAELVRNGIRSKDIMTMGFPYDIQIKSPSEIAETKQDMGLPTSKTVYVHISDKKKLEEVFSLILDQGGIVNLAVYCPDKKLRQLLSSRVAAAQNMAVVFVQSASQTDEYLSVCDIAILQYDPSLIYKCFRLGVPSIVMDGGEHVARDIDYLVAHGLCLRAKDNIEIVALLYKLLQTRTADDIVANGRKWVEFNSIENIANFLVSYIVM